MKGLRFLLFIGVLLAATSAWGALLSGDPLAIPGYTGTVAFADPLNKMMANLDYAVYAPGVYPGTDPSNGTQYVYAYQLFNSSLPTSYVTTLTVGIDSPAVCLNTGNDAAYGQLGGTLATLVLPTQSSFYVTFLMPQLAPGTYSTVARFTSPYGPTWRSASITDSGRSSQRTAPSPVPEPISLVLLGLGAMAALKRR